MTDSTPSTTKRVLRILLGGAALATAWLAIDALAHSDAASADEIVDIQPIGSGPISGLLDTVLTPVVSIATPVVDTTVSGVLPIATPVIQPVLPVLQSVTTPLTPVVAPLVPVVETVISPFQPIVDTVVAPILPVVTIIVDAVRVVTEPILSSGLGLVIPVGGGLVVGALAASGVPVLPLPRNGGGRDVPPAPVSSGGSAASTFAEVISAFFAKLRSALSSLAIADGLPPSPAYAFDTTPD